jgi:hypothetical protein
VQFPVIFVEPHRCISLLGSLTIQLELFMQLLCFCLSLRYFLYWKCLNNRALNTEASISADRQTGRQALEWLYCLVDSEETVKCFSLPRTMSIERDGRLKTTLCIYGDILSAIRETAYIRRSYAMFPGRYRDSKTRRNCPWPRKVSEPSASHVKWIDRNTWTKRT